MGFIFSKLWKKIRGQTQCKLALVGLANAGKTTILYKFQLGTLVSSHPTIGSNVEEFVYHNVRLQVWDLGGQESLRACWSNYYSNSQGVIFVVDSADQTNCLLAKMELFNLIIHPDMKNVPILILANKQDLPVALPAERLADVLSVEEIRDHEWHIQGCSAVTDQGIYEGLDWLTDRLVN